MATQRYNHNLAVRKLILWLASLGSGDPLTTAPTITAGSGDASASEADGSIFLSLTKGIQTRLSSAWGWVGQMVYRAVAASTAITGTQEAATNFDSSYTIPAGRLQAGTVIRVRCQGIHTATTGSETHTIALKIGSTTIVSFAAVDPADNDIFYFDAVLVVRTAGASGTIVGTGTALSAAASAVGTAKPFALASTAIDTTATQVVAANIDRQTTATDTDSARVDVMVVEIIG